jgi:fructose-bisphosphate aldolase/2-amino-3,7-dideoxy-D-threo-hept-6-ulosonate synthase
MTGKQIRFNRLLKNGKMLCVPLDHGVTIENIGHLSEFVKTVRTIVENGATAIIVHKGMVRFIPQLKQTGLIVHLSASTSNNTPVHKIVICEIEEAIALGADAVSIHINLGNSYEKDMLSDFARISRDCSRYGMPLLAMMYMRNDANEDISTIASEKHSIRIASEFGADIVKIGAKWDCEELNSIIDDALIPIVVAGGEILCHKDFFMRTENLLMSGILGVSFGRNVFMSDDPQKTMQKLNDVLFKKNSFY